MSSIATPADRRFRRAHVKPARARRGWVGRLRPLLAYAPAVLLVAYAIHVGSSSVTQARVLRIDRILVRGNERLSQADILALLGGLRGESLVLADLDHWRQRLVASTWVREAVLRRSFPSTVEVVVWERQPIGIGRLDDEMFLVDAQGAIIDRYGPQYADLDLPIVDGLSAPGGTTTDPERGALAERVIAALTAEPEIAERLSQIDVTDPYNVQIILSGDPAVISLGDDRFLGRLQSYLELAPTLRTRVADIDRVDVRFDDRIYVRPAAAAKRKR